MSTDISEMLREKRLSRISIRMGESIRNYLEEQVQLTGARSMSEYIIKRATEPDKLQADLRQTLADDLKVLHHEVCRLRLVSHDLHRMSSHSIRRTA